MSNEVSPCTCVKAGYRNPAPYPDTSGAQQNASDAAILLTSYACAVSETTAVMSYLYRSHALLAADERVSNTFEQISLVEMTHADLLASAITTLGGDPKYVCPKCGKPWTAQNVDYTNMVTQSLKRSIEEENTAIAQYREQIVRLSQPCLKALLERIILDEELHVRIFCDLLRQCGGR